MTERLKNKARDAKGNLVLLLFIGMALATLVSCTSATVASTKALRLPEALQPTDLAARYEQLRSEGRVLVLQPANSAVRIFAFRAGPAAKVGHNHVLSAPRFQGYLFLPTADTASARFDLEFRLDQLTIDDESIRANLGSAFSSKLTQAAIDGTRDHMLGGDNLEANRFPFVRIHSIAVTGEGSEFAAEIEVEMHGQNRTMMVPLRVEGLPDRVMVAGAFVMRQTDFGAKPYSVLGGLLAVKDEVVIEFEVQGS
jgi:hypothetical protein